MDYYGLTISNVGTELGFGKNETWYMIVRYMWICGWNSTSPGTSIGRKLGWWSPVTFTTNQQRSQSILYFKVFDKLLDGFADHLQQPDILVHNNIEDVFVKLRDRNNCDKCI